MNCMCNRDNAHDVDIFPDAKITERSEPTNQVQTKINIAKGLQTYLNDLKNYLSTYQGFKIRLLILKILGKYWYILNKWRIVWTYFIASTLKVKVWYNSTPYSDMYWKSVIHLVPGSTCHWISNWMRYFLKNMFWLKHFPAITNCRSRHLQVFLAKAVLKIS